MARCKYGKLKHKVGNRRCRKRRPSKNPGQTAWRRQRTRTSQMDRTFGRRR